MYLRIKKRLYDILELISEDDRVSQLCHRALFILIALNTLAVVLESVPVLSQRYRFLFNAFETFSVIVFMLEYLLRVWTCTVDPRYASPVQGRLRFALTVFALIDLIAILPFFLPLVMNVDFRFVRILRFFRLLRLLKLGRYFQSLRLFGQILHNKKEELVVALGGVLLVLLFASAGMYTLEHTAQPNAFSSIPASMWWGISTLTTVGYGDIYPITPLGKVLGSLISLFGIGLIALPAGILASGFAEAIDRQRHTEHVCPHCGKIIPDSPT